jgi:16S rRNA (cytidine1402-2'-O)-methyltransferase
MMRARTEPAKYQLDQRPGRSTFAVSGQVFPSVRPAGGLYLVATPIGNLGDITIRALETLAGVDLIACEDTRVTRKLLDRFQIATPLSPYHDHNAATARPKLLEKLANGAAIALVSDAGTPLISDPGFKLVREASAAGMTVIALPGASSVLTALCVAGLPTDRFFFEGFLPARAAARRSRIAELARIDATLVLFESGSRIAGALQDLGDAFGERDAAICREMTKLHEQIERGKLAQLAERADALETRGEFVVVVGPPGARDAMMSDADLDQALAAALARSSVKDAVAEISTISGRGRRDVYARALELAKSGKPGGGDGRR